MPKKYSTQERLDKIRQLIVKLSDHAHRLDKEEASADYRITLQKIDDSMRHLGNSFKPYSHD